jgi:hypothetical protein
MVTDVRVMEGGVVRWNFDWRRRLFVWEEGLAVELMETINSVELSEEEDRWGWVFNGGGDFTVKSTYWSVVNLFVPMDPVGLIESKAFSSLWKSGAPSKVLAFAWQLLLDKIPTRHNLLRRQIPLPAGDQLCVWCGSEQETSLHLFLYCDFTRKVWAEVCIWLNLDFSLPHNLFSTLNLLQGVIGKKAKKTWSDDDLVNSGLGVVEDV